MKTTIDLPDTIAELIRKGIAGGKTRSAKIPKPVKLCGGFVRSIEDIEAAIAWGRNQS